ncbi:NAD(P)H-dependent oxidoreductase [Olivibacter sp. SDN3]|uniref:NADPH-dependent FMN reductase n=1 Tax=Olivibacter sp. SDN3 TaxID=2764720 RepID=UPI00165196D5|nr:NAD(P)H-dependent oxidoreductase [Olivibacter sp. SDN3]QNL50438.1 NAD(P)H-dependent oxidoreductase [Olivibacter sp. SDN3]
MITIIAGTNRKNSYSLKVANYYQQQLDKKGLGSEILSLEDLPDNFIVSDLYGARSEAFQPIQNRITATTKFIFIIPEYNGSFPGVLKILIDGCLFPDSFVGKKAALVGISSGKYGNIRGVEHFTGICHYLQLHILPIRIHIPYIKQEINDDITFHKEDTLKFTDQQIEAFIRF